MAEKRSNIELWKYFKSVGGRTAVCCLCKTTISYKSTITNLKIHLRRKHTTAFTSLQSHARLDGGTTEPPDLPIEVKTETDTALIRKKKRKKVSDTWKFFTSVRENAARCELCKTIFSHKSTISNLKIHLKRKHFTAFRSLKSHSRNYTNEEPLLFISALAPVTDEETSVPQSDLQSAQTSPLNSTTVAGQQSFSSNISPKLAPEVKKEIDSTLLRCLTRIEKRRKTSQTWKYFRRVNDRIAICNLCATKISYKSTMSNLTIHLKRKHKTAFLDLKSNQDPLLFDSMVAAEELAPQSGVKSTQISLQNSARTVRQESIASHIPRELTFAVKAKIDTALLSLVIKDYQPLCIVEDEGFKEFCAVMNPSYELPSSKTISSKMLPEAYIKCQEVVKEMINNETVAVCLTTDTWTSRSNAGYLAVTAHYITSDFEFKSILIECSSIIEPPTSEKLAEELHRIATDWEINDKINLVVSDNALNMKSAIKNNLGWEHYGCFAHKLNLVVQDALKLFTDITDKVENICTYFRKSSTAKENLIEHQFQNSVGQPVGLKNSMPTRWNSMLYMLERFTSLQESVQTTIALLNIDLLMITDEEWDVCRQLCKVLKPFEEATVLISSENYLSASLPIVIVRSLQSVCAKLEMEDFCPIIKYFINELKEGMVQRFHQPDRDIRLSRCTFLDPRFKTHYFSDEEVTNSVITAIKYEMMNKIIAEESENGSPSDESVFIPSKSNSVISLFNEVDSFVDEVKHTRRTPQEIAQNEIDQYLKDDLLARNKCPLQWWKEHCYAYKYLSRMLIHNFNIVASSVPCERFFSKTGFVVNDRLCSLRTNKVQELVFLHANSQHVKEK